MSGVVGKLTDIVSKNLGWDAQDDSQANAISNASPTPLADVLQAVDDHLDAQAGGGAQQGERYEVTQSPAMSSVQAIERLARANAAVRKRCTTIARKVESLTSLDQDLSSVFNHFDVVMGDLEQTHATLAETAASLAGERDAHDAMKVRYAAALEEGERQRNQLQRQDETIKDLEASVEQLNQLLFERSQTLTELRAQEEQNLERLAGLMLDLQAARDEQQRQDRQISQLQDNLSAVGLRAELAEETSSAIEAALRDARQTIAELESSVRAAADDLAEARATGSDLQNERDRLVLAHADELTAWRTERDKNQAETAVLSDQLAALTVRFESADRLLADLPVLLERAANWERKVNDLTAQKERLQAKLNASEAAQQEVADRAQTLVKAIKVKEKETSRMQASLAEITERHERLSADIAAERDAWSKTRTDLSQQVEKERAERLLVQASLECLQLERAEALQAEKNRVPNTTPVSETATLPLAAEVAAEVKLALVDPSPALAPSQPAPAIVAFSRPPEALQQGEADKGRPRPPGKGQRHRNTRKRQVLRIE
jgi:chromosome segregation ATPase